MSNQSKALELADKWEGGKSLSIAESGKLAYEMAAELRRLDAEAEQLRKDAARYRWLRAQHEDGEYRFRVSEFFCYGWDFVGELDSKIDDEMKN